MQNFGVNGTTVLRSSPASYHYTEEWQDALFFEPDIAIIELGANDLAPGNIDKHAEVFIADYAQIINAIRVFSPSVKVYITSLTPIDIPLGEGQYLETWHARIQEMLRAISANCNAILIDIYTPLMKETEKGALLFPDGIHPNNDGASIISYTVLKALMAHTANR